MIENPPPPPAAPSAPAPVWKPNWLWAVLAAICPLAACPVTPVVAIASRGVRDEPTRLFYEGGSFAYLTLGVFSLSAVAITVLVVLMARGVKIPATLVMGMSVLPWLTGVAGMRLGLNGVLSAITNVNPADKATIMAAGIAEASACRLLGTYLASGLFAASGLALGLAALANAKKLAPVGLLAAGAAVPVLAACFLVPNFREVGPSMFLVLLPATAFLIAAALGGLGGASGEPRSALLLAVLGVPAALAVTALARGVGVAGMINVFQAVANVSPDDKATLLAAGAAELTSADTLGTVVLGLGALGALGLFAFGAVKTANKTPLIIEVALSAALGLLAVGADASALSAAAKATAGLDVAPWEKVSTFQPLNAAGEHPSEDAWLLEPDKLTAPDGTVIAAPFSSEGQGKLGEKLDRPADDPRGLARGSFSSWTVAVDRRVSSADFAKLVEVARAAQVKQVSVVGKREHPLPGNPSAWWVGLVGNTTTENFDLAPATGGYEEPKPYKLIKADEAALDTYDSRFAPALSMEGVELQKLLDFAGKLRSERRGTPLLVGPDGLDALEEQAEPDEREEEGSEGGADELDPEVRKKLEELFGKKMAEGKEVTDEDIEKAIAMFQKPDTMGDFKETIADGVRQHVHDFKACYESQLRKKPSLEGKVVLKFTIGTAGTVTAATVASTTMNDATVESCLVTQMKKVKFAVHPKTVTEVNYPFVFSPAK
ncbi:MAG: AgmX/PglI C-terminal domain-containing protein [Myxococcaceae bacterium]